MGKRRREATTSSAEATELQCSVCSETDSPSPASWYCRQCRQLLCDICQRSNCNMYGRYCTRKRVKMSASKAHDLIRAEDANLDAPAALKEPSGQEKSLQCGRHEQPFQFYCKIHSMPACASCKVEDHRDCAGLQDLELAATENTEVCGEVLEHLKAISASMDDISEAMIEEKNNMETEKAAVIQKIMDKVREINTETNKEALVQKDKSNDLGEKQISDVETMFKKENTSMDKERKAIEESKEVVLRKIQELELASTSGSAKEQFLTAKLAIMDAGRYYNILFNSSHVMHKNIGIIFGDEMGDTGSLGEITIDKNMNPVYYHQHLVQVINVENGTLVPWMGLLPSKQIILISGNDHAALQLYSPDKDILSELSVPVLLTVAVHENQLIALRERETGLQLISIDQNRLTKGQHIETGIEHISIAKFSETSILTVNVEPHVGFEIRDLNGNTKTQIPINEEGIQRPVHVRVNKSSNIIYMVDNEKGCYGFNLKGECLFHFEQKDDHESIHKYLYTGLVTDQDDNLYFSCTKLNDDPEKVISTVVQLSPYGLLQKYLLNVPTIVFPIHCIENKLYLSICFPDGRYGEGRVSGVYQMFV